MEQLTDKRHAVQSSPQMVDDRWDTDIKTTVWLIYPPEVIPQICQKPLVFSFKAASHTLMREIKRSQFPDFWVRTQTKATLVLFSSWPLNFGLFKSCFLEHRRAWTLLWGLLGIFLLLLFFSMFYRSDI